MSLLWRDRSARAIAFPQYLMEPRLARREQQKQLSEGIRLLEEDLITLLNKEIDAVAGTYPATELESEKRKAFSIANKKALEVRALLQHLTKLLTREEQAQW